MNGAVNVNECARSLTRVRTHTLNNESSHTLNAKLYEIRHLTIDHTGYNVIALALGRSNFPFCVQPDVM